MFQTTNQSSLGYSSLVSNNGRIKANGFAPLSSLQAKLSLSNTSESKHVQAIWQLMTLDDSWGHSASDIRGHLTTLDDSSWQLMTWYVSLIIDVYHWRIVDSVDAGWEANIAMRLKWVSSAKSTNFFPKGQWYSLPFSSWQIESKKHGIWMDVSMILVLSMHVNAC
jgi:hypothetical protein